MNPGLLCMTPKDSGAGSRSSSSQTYTHREEVTVCISSEYVNVELSPAEMLEMHDYTISLAHPAGQQPCFESVAGALLRFGGCNKVPRAPVTAARPHAVFTGSGSPSIVLDGNCRHTSGSSLTSSLKCLVGAKPYSLLKAPNPANMALGSCHRDCLGMSVFTCSLDKG